MFSEQELLMTLRHRDADAFTLLFETYSDKIYRLAIGLLEDEAEAEGIVQETFLRFFERLDQFEGRSEVGTWLYRVAYNASIDQLRRHKPLVSMDFIDDEENLPLPAVFADWSQWPERQLSDAEVTAELDKAIASLPEKYRAIFILREIEGLSTRETAQVTDLSISAVKVRLHRARLSLREHLAESLVARIGEYVDVGKI
jgi:RNA polymerase sigma-70 factor (ECF subfamily)